MITEKDKQFIAYWEKSRNAESTFLSKLLRGLPMALLFAFPVILAVLIVWLFFPEWYYKISGTSAGMFVTVVIAVMILTVFYSFFRMHYKWEMNEQLYQELKIKQAREQQQNGSSVNKT